jgi:uncharacterized protein YvpB
MKLALCAAAMLAASGVTSGPQQPRSAFLGFKGTAAFEQAHPDKETSVLTLKGVDPKMDWDEMIASWNIHARAPAELTVCAIVSGQRFCLGVWRQPGGKSTSVDGQKNEVGRVSTDTLQLVKPARTVDIELTLKGADATLKFFGISFLNSSAPREGVAAEPAAYGRTLNAPMISQMAFPRGKELCSPTSVTMDLRYWSEKLERPDLSAEVPHVSDCVWDEAFKGAGNWPFNTAFAGSLPGVRAYVTRLSTVAELEQWIAAGIPVVCSASLPMLEGKPRPHGDSGHLVLLVGFEKNGDPIFNDPGWTHEIRHTYKRENFEAAWDTSKRTVYMIYPESTKVPEDRLGHWFAG